MTETNTTDYMAEMPMPGSFKEMYDLFKNQLAALDEQLDSSQDAAGAGRRKILNELLAETKSEVDPNVQALVSQIDAKADYDERTKLAMYQALSKALSEKFEDRYEKWVGQEVESRKSELSSTKLDQDTIDKLSKQRSGIYKNMKSLREIALGFPGASDADYPEPRRRAGKLGKRGPRAMNLFSWSINGDELPKEQNKLEEIAKLYEDAIEIQVTTSVSRATGETVTKKLSPVASLRRLIEKTFGEENDLSNPPEFIQYNIKPGVILTGKKIEPQGEQLEEGDDDDDDDEDESETVEVV